MRPIGIERRDGLVEEDDRRPADEGLGDAEALAHAARVGRGAPVGRFGDADAPEQLGDLALAIGSDAAEAGDVAERLAPGHPAVEPRILGEVAELAAMLAGRGDRDAVDGGASGRRPGEPGEDLEGGRLAGAVRAEEAEDGAGRDVERQVGQCLDALVVLGQPIHRDGVGHGVSLLSSRRAAATRQPVGLRMGSRRGHAIGACPRAGIGADPVRARSWRHDRSRRESKRRPEEDGRRLARRGDAGRRGPGCCQAAASR